MYQRVPLVGGEKESLQIANQRHRDVVLWKINGLDDEQLRRPMTPTGTTLLGLVKHLAATEYGWFCVTFGRPTEPWVEKLDALVENDLEVDMRVEPGESTQDIVDFYRRSIVAANAATNELDLDATGTSWHGDVISMRWVLIHMLEETARHAGQMDIIRELIDGAAGDHNRPPDI